MSNLRRNLAIAFACLIFLLLVLASRVWGRFFTIPTSAMADSVPVGAYIYTFNTQKVQRNDIIVFRYPLEEGDIAQKTPYLKRLIGLPGDSLQVKEGKVYINVQAE
ncbi:MAG: signal peptidase I, partial [Bacteroidota bacterium]